MREPDAQSIGLKWLAFERSNLLGRDVFQSIFVLITMERLNMQYYPWFQLNYQKIQQLWFCKFMYLV